MENFSKYTVNVEHDLESLIFSMLNLIDTKTKTLKKLIKLHLQIKSIKNSANNKKHLKSHQIVSTNNLPMLFRDSVDDLTFSEDFQQRRNLNELKRISGSLIVSHRNDAANCTRGKSFEGDKGTKNEFTADFNEFCGNRELVPHNNISDTTDDEEVCSKEGNISIVEVPEKVCGEF